MQQLPLALGALGRELIGFRFDYPLEMVAGAGQPGSLRYHVYSDSLFSEDLHADADGVVMRAYRAQGRQYNPVFIAWRALMDLERYHRGRDPDRLRSFQAQVRWLEEHAEQRPDGTTVWQYPFDWQEGRCLLKAPWISAMSQGLGISALVRAFRMTGDDRLLALCLESARVFEHDVAHGGVRTLEQGHVLYEEYPGYPLARVLDGFLFSLLGLNDLARETRSASVTELFRAGIDGLKFKLADWDYRRKWTWYGTHGYLCPPHYHRLNGLLVQVLAQLTQDPVLLRYGERWSPRALTRLEKSEVFAMFAFTKNLARLRLPRN